MRSPNTDYQPHFDRETLQHFIDNQLGSRAQSERYEADLAWWDSQGGDCQNTAITN